MRIKFELKEASRLAYSRAPAIVTDADLSAHMSEIDEAFKHGKIDASWRQIYDFSEVENIDGVTMNNIHALAKWMPIPWPEEALRIWVVPTEITSALAHLYKDLGGRKTNRLILVNTLEEAMRCLELDGDDNCDDHKLSDG